MKLMNTTTSDSRRLNKASRLAVLFLLGGLILPLLCASCKTARPVGPDDNISNVINAKEHSGQNRDYLVKRLDSTRNLPPGDDPAMLEKAIAVEVPSPLYMVGAGDVIAVAYFRKPSSETSEQTNDEYRLDCMDVITVNVDTESGSTYDITVRPDGRISFFQVEDLFVRGKTLKETRAMLSESLTNVLAEAEVSVLLRKGSVMLNEFLDSLKTESDGTTRTIRIRQDGCASFPLAGDIQVAGKTIPEITRQLQERYDGIFVSGVSININLVSSFLGNVIVIGEVRHPGAYSIHDKVNPIHAIALAGGVLETGSEKDAILVRRTQEGKFRHWRIDLRTAWMTDKSSEILMEPQDILVVPKTAIANADLFIEQYVRRLLPIPVSASINASHSLDK